MPILDKPLKEDKNKKSLLHAILFPKSLYTFKDALNWLNYHKMNFIHNRETKNIWRFRIREQIKDYKFFTKVLSNGVELIFMYK